MHYYYNDLVFPNKINFIHYVRFIIGDHVKSHENFLLALKLILYYI